MATTEQREAANRALASPETVAALDRARAVQAEAKAFAADLRRKLMAADARQRAASHAVGQALRRVNAEAAAARTLARKAARDNRKVATA
jgi:hypothetical protein